VLNRGIERRPIFRSSKCYSHFVELLAHLPKRFGVRIHDYVLMTIAHFSGALRSGPIALTSTV
jgi:hypothetical protein